jgi:hypothetical protein
MYPPTIRQRGHVAVIHAFFASAVSSPIIKSV